MTPSFRKSILTAHVAFSVGWLGAVAAFLALAIAAVGSKDPQTIHVAYPAMELAARFVIVPLAFAALASGIVQSLATPWGLFRHSWIVAKLLLTVFATVVLVKKMPLIAYAARHASGAASSSADLRAAGAQLVLHAAGGLVVLLAITALSVFKPWGLTRYGQRKAREKSGQLPPQPLPRPGLSLAARLSLFFALVAALVSALAAHHMAGHGFRHSH